MYVRVCVISVSVCVLSVGESGGVVEGTLGRDSQQSAVHSPTHTHIYIYIYQTHEMSLQWESSREILEESVVVISLERNTHTHT